jgi:hypothetical protein
MSGHHPANRFTRVICRVLRAHKQRGETYLQLGYSQRHARGGPRLGGLYIEATARCGSGSGQLLIGLPQTVAGRAAHPRFGCPELVRAMTRDAALRDNDCGQYSEADKPRDVTRCRSRLSCGRWSPATCPEREPPLACFRRCLAGYGQSRRARGLPFGSASAA